MKIAILTSANQWYVPYAKELKESLKSKLFYNHLDIKESFDVLFILSYHKIIPEEILKKNRHNIVIHESDLPKGKGWAPLFWQILEGKNKIVFSMFEATKGIDSGNIYMKKVLKLNGYELNAEIRKKQASLIKEMCIEFIKNYEKYKNPTPQVGEESFYPKRAPKDSELDINKTIKEQFNLLRIVDNKEYPAFFTIDGHKYILTIRKADEDRKS